jgi:hypothetical protein
MNEHEQELRSLVSMGGRDAKQLRTAVDAACRESAPAFCALARESLPPHLHDFAGAVFVETVDILAESVEEYLVDETRGAATAPTERRRTPIAMVIREFTIGTLTLTDLVGQGIIQRAVRNVLNEEGARFRKPNLQLIDADGNRETFDDYYDRVQRERGTHRSDDALSIMLRTEQRETLRARIGQLKRPVLRVVVALREDLLGASATLQLGAGPKIMKGCPEAENLKKWLVEVLKLDTIAAKRISSRYRRHAVGIRERAFGNQVRAGSFVISNEDIGLLLDCTGSAVCQMAESALRELRKFYAEEMHVA